MGNAWLMYLNDAKGKLPVAVWHNAPPGSGYTGARLNEFIWHGFWFGILNDYRVGPGQVLCPEASEPIPYNLSLAGGIIGAGTARYAWSGQHQTSSPVGIMIDQNKVNNTSDASKGGYRVGSYGFNGNLFAAARKKPSIAITPSSESHFGFRITDVSPTTDVPVFYDATWIDNLAMENGTPTAQPTPPTNLQGALSPAGDGNNDWRFLLDRHDKAICVVFADGHASRVLLPETYKMKWTPYWLKYTRTNLPRK